MSKRTDSEDFLHEARERFQQAAEAEAQQRQLMLEDKEFRQGRQWPDQVQAARMIDQRPCLVIDKLSGPIRQITNAQRQSRFGIDVIPVGESDQDTAEVFQGLIRHIEVESHAQVAYAWAFEDAVSCGRGWWRILTDYAGDDSFDQDIKIRRVLNPFSVYIDPSHEEPDGSDARYAFVVDDIPKAEYKQRFPKSEMASLEAFASLGDRSPDWYPEGKIRVAEYWWREPKNQTLAHLADGRYLPVDGEAVKAGEHEGIPILDTRDVDSHVVKWALINAAEVLDERDWPGKYIPLVPVVGEELNIAGERVYRGLVRSAKDPQRMYNYWASALTEAIALAPRAPFIGVEGQFEGHEQQWKQANLRSFPYLEYKPTSIAGVPAPAPQRQIAEPPIQALVLALQQSDEQLKATTGMFDPSLGNLSSKERSGRAILALQKQGEQANSNFVDNLARSITHTGRILVDLIPAIYDRPGRIVRLIGQDEQAKSVALNAPFVPGPQGQPQVLPPQAPPPPQAKLYDLRKGRYAVRVQVGPSYNTRRQETVANMMDLLGGNSSMWPLVGDLVFAEMDWPGAKPISERLKKMLPPQLQDDQGQQAPIPPQVQAQMQQAGQMIDVLTQRVNELTSQVQLDQAKAQADLQMKQMEIQSRERIAAMQVQADLTKVEAQLNAQAAQKLMAEQFAALNGKADRQHELLMGVLGQRHESALQGQQQVAQAQEGEAQRSYDWLAQSAAQEAQAGEAERQRQYESQESEAGREHEQTLAEFQAKQAKQQAARNPPSKKR